MKNDDYTCIQLVIKSCAVQFGEVKREEVIMKRFNKVVSAVVAAAMVLSMAGCGSSEAKKGSSDTFKIGGIRNLQPEEQQHMVRLSRMQFSWQWMKLTKPVVSMATSWS